MTDYMVRTAGHVWRQTATEPMEAAVLSLKHNRFDQVGVLIEIVPVDGDEIHDAVYVLGTEAFKRAGYTLDQEAK